MFWAYPHMMYGYSPFGGIFSFIIPIIIIVLFVSFFISLFRRNTEEGEEEQEGQEKPIDILKKRYAKGDITKKEFDQMKKDIS